jgi:hypothetical protein
MLQALPRQLQQCCLVLLQALLRPPHRHLLLLLVPLQPVAPALQLLVTLMWLLEVGLLAAL